MRSCARCATVPEPPSSTGTLYLAPPLAHTMGNLRRTLRGLAIPFEEPGERIVSVPLKPGRLDEVVTALAGVLSASERRDTRSLLLGDGAPFSIASLLETLPLSTLTAQIQERWLAEMIREGRLTSHFQPIVRADAPGEVYAYECLLRGQDADGSLRAPTAMYDAARDADLLFQLDRAARITAIREAVRHRIRERLFINFNPSSIYDPVYCLKSTVAAIEEAGIDPSRIVFEVVESDHVDVDLLGIMATYRRAGFGVALDDLGAGYGSLNLLSRLRPDVVKLDMKLVRNVHIDSYKAEITSQLLAMARHLGVATVAEGIESAEELAWFRDHGADFVQGYYIARPASPPPRHSAAAIEPAGASA
jgi:EAL domain-containing protein (putative c-di-GMP-specific phosphodiesterase class I)